MTRKATGMQSGVRGISLPPDYKILSTIDRDLINRKAKAASGHELTGRSSHVLLAACSRDELAGERESGGAFTTILLGLLRSVRLDTITYEDVISRLPSLPQCAVIILLQCL